MAVPAITSISPSGGSVDGGTTVTITGTALGTPTGISFGATPAASFAGVSATQAFAVSPAGTGAVHVKLTTAGGTSAEVAADTFTYGAGLFTVSDARAWDKAQLASTTTYTNAAIIAKHDEILEWLTRVLGVDPLPTVHTDEYHDGDGSQYLLLNWPRVTAVSAVSTRSDSTWTALTAGELTDLHVVSDSITNEVYREGSYWPSGVRNLKVTYTAGYATVPELIKRAALWIAVTELPTSNVPAHAESWDDGGVGVSFMRADGFNEQWHRLPEVMKAIRMYSHKMPGIA